MTSNIGRGQRRRTFDFNQEDSLLPIKRKATCSLDPVAVAQVQKLELDVACSISAEDLADSVSMSQQPSRSASPPESLSFSDVSRSLSIPSDVGGDMMDIDPGPSNRASRQSIAPTEVIRHMELAGDSSLESSPHARHESWANLPGELILHTTTAFLFHSCKPWSVLPISRLFPIPSCSSGPSPGLMQSTTRPTRNAHCFHNFNPPS